VDIEMKKDIKEAEILYFKVL